MPDIPHTRLALSRRMAAAIWISSVPRQPKPLQQIVADGVARDVGLKNPTSSVNTTTASGLVGMIQELDSSGP